MNLLSIDYGSKNIGLAISISGIIEPIKSIKNDNQVFSNLNKIIQEFRIEKIYIGISEGHFADVTKKFVEQLKNMLTLPIETVEEAVSTIEAEQIFIANNNKRGKLKKNVDSIAAAVILRRVIS